MDCSEITKGSVFTNSRTKSRKRVRWEENSCPGSTGIDEPDINEEEDEFEKEMLTVLEERIHKAEVDSGIKSNYIDAPASVNKNTEEGFCESSSSGNKKSYDPIYFDSDDDSDDQSNLKPISDKDKRKPVVSNDELMYGPELDDDDQAWADNIRNSYLGNSQNR